MQSGVSCAASFFCPLPTGYCSGWSLFGDVPGPGRAGFCGAEEFYIVWEQKHEWAGIPLRTAETPTLGPQLRSCAIRGELHSFFFLCPGLSSAIFCNAARAPVFRGNRASEQGAGRGPPDHPEKNDPFGTKSFVGRVCISERLRHQRLADHYEAVQSGVSCAASFFCPYPDPSLPARYLRFGNEQCCVNPSCRNYQGAPMKSPPGTVPLTLKTRFAATVEKNDRFGNKSSLRRVCIYEGSRHQRLTPNYEAVQSGVSCAASFFLSAPDRILLRLVPFRGCARPWQSRVLRRRRILHRLGTKARVGWYTLTNGRDTNSRPAITKLCNQG